MKRTLALILLLLVCAMPLAANADCPSRCVEACSAGAAEDYATCLDKCLAGCNPDPVPPVPAPTPVPDSTD